MFKFQKLSNYGTSTPAVARTVLQAKPIVDVFNCTEEQRNALLEKLFDVQRHLLKCVECRDSLAAEIEEERTSYVMPQVDDPRAKGAYRGSAGIRPEIAHKRIGNKKMILYNLNRLKRLGSWDALPFRVAVEFGKYRTLRF